MIIELNLPSYNGKILDDVGTGEDGQRYFCEKDGSWQINGLRSKRWKAILSGFRRSDWGDRNGFHISGCPSNQYLMGGCSIECGTFREMLYNDFGGFPKDFDPGQDERNQYRSSVESYG